MKQLEKFLREQKLKIIFTFLLIFVGWVSIRILIPEISAIIRYRGELAEKKIQFAKLQKKREVLESFTNDILTYLADAEKAIPSEKDAASILASLENIAATTGHQVDQIEFSPGLISSPAADRIEIKNTPIPQPANLANIRKGANFLLVKIATRGTSESFLKFVDTLTNSRRIFDIESVSLDFLPQGPDFLGADFNLVVYYLNPITQIGSLESELPQLTSEEQTLLANLTSLPYLSSIAPLDIGVPATFENRTNLFTNQ